MALDPAPNWLTDELDVLMDNLLQQAGRLPEQEWDDFERHQWELEGYPGVVEHECQNMAINPLDVTRESCVCHLQMTRGFESWREALDLARSGEADPAALESAEWACRLMAMVERVHQHARPSS